jgi:hypothetical protein
MREDREMGDETAVIRMQRNRWPHRKAVKDTLAILEHLQSQERRRETEK